MTQPEFFGFRRVSATSVKVFPIEPRRSTLAPTTPPPVAVNAPASADDAAVEARCRRVADRMVAYLEAAHGWRTREEIGLDIGLTERECRIGRSHSGMRIIFGQHGFRATSQATLEEITTCADTLLSQSDELRKQAIQLRKAAHARIGG